LTTPDRSVDTTRDRPRTSAETLLCDLWTEVLDVPPVGIHDNFFELGGDSILAVQVLSRLRDAAGVDISIVRFSDAPTVAAMAARLPASADTLSTDAAILTSSRVVGDRPLSLTQQRIWILNRLEPENPAYNVAMSLRLDGALDLPALQSSLNNIVRRHEILRTTFPTDDGHPVQRIASSPTLGIEVVDLTTRPSGGRDGEAWPVIGARSGQPFDLARGPLVRVTLVRLDAQQHLLQLDMHHIIADAWSRRILLSELLANYRAFASGEPGALAKLPCQYAAFAEWQRQALAPDVIEREIAFWKTQLAGAPDGVPLPLESRASAIDRGDEVHQSIALSGDLAARIRTFSRRHQVTPFMTLTAALDVLLWQLTGELDIVLGVPVAGRSRPEFEQLVGCFVNVVVLRADLSGNPTFAELLTRVRESALTAFAHQELPFNYVVDALQPQRSPGRTPLVNVMFDFVDDDAYAPARRAGVLFTPLDVAAPMPNVDLLLSVNQVGDGFSVRLHYRRAALSPEQGLDLLRRFERLLEQAIEAPTTPILSHSVAAI
jgi:aryl carrier-like protein